MCIHVYKIIRKIFEGRRRSFYRSVADCTWRENLKIDKRREEAEEMETGREDSDGRKGKSFYECLVNGESKLSWRAWKERKKGKRSICSEKWIEGNFRSRVGLKIERILPAFDKPGNTRAGINGIIGNCIGGILYSDESIFKYFRTSNSVSNDFIPLPFLSTSQF